MNSPQDTRSESHFSEFAKKMEKEGLSSKVIDTFQYYYEKLVEGETGFLSDDEISPLNTEDIMDIDALKRTGKGGNQYLDKAVIIKLNGGLGTSMGMSYPKSLIPVKNDYSFLDIFLYQAREYGDRMTVPVVLMNSFSTQEDTKRAVEKVKNEVDIPWMFLQNKFPKILQEDLSPVTWKKDPELEWNPPGHGDIYTALDDSGLLDKLLDQGVKYAFISNSDNLGAIMDEDILEYFARYDFPFMMEVAIRDESDMKGGHIARLNDGRLTLREIAQCPAEDTDKFMDIDYYRYFNTNNIWINLRSLKDIVEREGIIRLPMIVNPKTVDPRDESSPAVYQIETAMGAAISLFQGTTALRVNRDRYIPVKKTNQILALWSDAFILTDDFHIRLNPKRNRQAGPPVIDLDSDYFKKIDQLNERFSEGAPSLVDCVKLTVKGNVRFEKNVVIKGSVTVENRSEEPLIIPKETVIEDEFVRES